jgi:hypothetical protein
MLPVLGPYGFTASGGGGLRGESVTVTNGYLLIEVSVDYIEGELDVRCGTSDSGMSRLEDLLPRGPKALHTRRISRSSGVAVLSSALEKLITAMEEQRPDLLRSDG